MPTPEGTDVAADVVSFVDEAGDRGYLRDLTQESDDKISVLCALPVPAEAVGVCRELVRPAYDAFCAAAPEGSKLHITDAFASKNDAWVAAAYQSREEIFEVMRRCQLRVVYTARRFRIARQTYEAAQHGLAEMREKYPADKDSNLVVVGANRVNSEQVDDRLMLDLVLNLDMFVENAEKRKTDLYFDEINQSVADRYMAMVDRASNIGHMTSTRRLFNKETREKTERSFTITTNLTSHPGLRLAAEFVGSITVVGKADPLVFAADVTANSLWRHLKTLDPAAALNDRGSLEGWPLQAISFVPASELGSQMDRC